MMSLEGPFLAAVIARMAEPKENLAAYGVAFSLAVVIESPIIMMLSASNSLVRDRISLRKLFRFLSFMNLGITLLMLLVVMPPVYHLIAHDVMNLPPAVYDLAWVSLMLLIPWPAAIGFRRFYQGLLIHSGRTRNVAYGTVVRFLSMGATGLVLSTFFELPGAYVGCISLSVGVTCEMAATRFMARDVVRDLKAIRHQHGGDPVLTYPFISRFYFPLAMTAVISFMAQPMATLFVGTARESLNSLAVLPVIHGFMFLFTGIAISVQEAVVALSGRTALQDQRLARMARGIALVLSLLMASVTLSPLGDLWFIHVAGLSEELAAFIRLPVQIVSLMPALSVWVSFQRGMLVNRRQTRPVGIATALELFTIAFTLACTLWLLGWIGAIGAASAFVLGRLVDNLYLRFDRSRTNAVR
jgi:Na+-driven multidrug efflux pump